MDVSVVIPAYKERRFIERPLEALRNQEFRGEKEVIVVVNGGGDGTTGFVCHRFPKTRVLWTSWTGTNSARDVGWRRAKSEILAFLDADTEPPPWWLERGVGYFRDPSVVAVTGPYCYYDGRVRDRAFVFFKRWVFFPAAKAVAEYAGGSLFFFANVFMRRSALEAIGGLDTSIEYGGDDVDTAWRLAPLGRILYRHDLYVRTSARRLLQHGLMKTQMAELRYAREVAHKYRTRERTTINSSPQVP